MSGPAEVDPQVEREATHFLLREAELLDNRRFWEWLAELTDDATYVVPVLVTRDQAGGPEPAAGSHWLDETRSSLELRIRRLEAHTPVAEDPPSRTRHFVSNIRVRQGEREGEVMALSNVLVYRSRGDAPKHDLFSAERKDVLRRAGDGWKLARREVFLDQAVLESQDLSILL